ncbi:hypothetical protein D7319_10795 [Streptomyces radicis]|uniref:DUF2157 domain-containing protein n=1 Tax=Streptomyces radicis TaxID=1750517 RepID=A0A3A9WLC6_9ACTN|nr:hypothetical protein D7319_10795 [Streptomyces radicis]RKN24605.1 hypothetical protein D7318_11975 [Streptomyces radicis]
MPLQGPGPIELRAIDGELRRLDALRSGLLVRREALLGGLRAGVRANGPAGVPPAGGAPAPPPAPTPADAAPGTARDTLLILGGGLLTLAALTFMLLSWRGIGLGGRTLVLLTLTAAALAAPVTLLRRGLNATAEVVATLGLVLLLLDAFGLHRTAFPEADGLGYAAACAAAIAALWAWYGRLLPEPGLRLVLPTAVVVAQLALPLAALALNGGPGDVAWALLATAWADVALAVARRGPSAGARATAWVGALVTGGLALLLAEALPLGGMAAGSPAPSVSGALLLAAVAPPLLWAAHRRPGERALLAAGAGLALLGAAGGLGRWAVPAYLLPSVGLLAVAWWLERRGLGGRGRASMGAGLGLAAAFAQGAALLWALPAVAEAAWGPFAWAGAAWDGVPGGPARDALGPELAWSGGAVTPLALGVLAALAVAVRRLGENAVLRLWAARVALPLAAATGATALLAAGVGYAPTLAALVAAAAGLLMARHAVAGATGLALAATATGWALAEQAATFAVLGALAAALVVARGRAVNATHRRVAEAAAVLCLAGLARAVPAAFEVPSEWAAFAVLGVAVAAVAAGVGTARARSTTLEGAGYAVAGWALVLASGGAATASLALGVCGTVATAVALRPERRIPAGVAATALLSAALWVRLAASEVAVPEAYTLHLAVAALVLGAVRRRGDASVSSWRGYGAGLVALFLPSLVVVFSGPDGARALLLGAGALAVTIVGARHRLRALLALGGATVALVAAHEWGPYLTTALGLLPRWTPPACAGLLLLCLGATYERRMNEARRIHATWRRLD